MCRRSHSPKGKTIKARILTVSNSDLTSSLSARILSEELEASVPIYGYEVSLHDFVNIVSG